MFHPCRIGSFLHLRRSQVRKKQATSQLVAILLALAVVLFALHRAHAQQATTSIPAVVSVPPAGFTKISNVFTVDFTASLGTVITLDGLTATQAISGLLTTDQVHVSAIGALPVGIAIGNAYVSVNGTLSIRFVTSVIGNVALGSLSYRVTVFR